MPADAAVAGRPPPVVSVHPEQPMRIHFTEGVGVSLPDELAGHATTPLAAIRSDASVTPTAHPSWILRSRTDEERDAATDASVADLEEVAGWLSAR